MQVAGRDDLSQRVIRASRDIDDDLGFDSLSFDDADESERMREVRKTGLGKFVPFYVTGNEVHLAHKVLSSNSTCFVFSTSDLSCGFTFCTVRFGNCAS